MELPTREPDVSLSLIAYGHYGRPVLVFPTQAGHAWDFESYGMVDAVRDLIDSGRVKLYCVGSLDGASWSNTSVPTEERAQRNQVYTDWLVEQAVPWIRRDTNDGGDLMALGASLGAYHAVHLALQHPDLVPLAVGLSGNYDVRSWRAWGEPGDATYFANPTDYVPNAHGDHLQWLQQTVSILLICGQGAWETHPTGALPSSRRMADLLQDKAIRCELDLWGQDVSHDWPWWQRQLAHHLPRFC